MPFLARKQEVHQKLAITLLQVFFSSALQLTFQVLTLEFWILSLGRICSEAEYYTTYTMFLLVTCVAFQLFPKILWFKPWNPYIFRISSNWPPWPLCLAQPTGHPDPWDQFDHFDYANRPDPQTTLGIPFDPLGLPLGFPLHSPEKNWPTLTISITLTTPTTPTTPTTLTNLTTMNHSDNPN